MKKIRLPKLNQKMKAILITILCIIFSVGAVIGGFFIKKSYKAKNPETYIAIGYVETVYYSEEESCSIVRFKLDNGYLYEIYTKEFYAENERYELTFNSKNTYSVFDDEIILIARPFN